MRTHLENHEGGDDAKVGVILADRNNWGQQQIITGNSFQVKEKV